MVLLLEALVDFFSHEITHRSIEILSDFSGFVDELDEPLDDGENFIEVETLDLEWLEVERAFHGFES